MRVIEAVKEHLGVFTVRLELIEEQGHRLEPVAIDLTAFETALERGDLLRFTACVSVFCEGLELSQEHLSNCVYAGADDFIASGYYADMKESALHDAQDRIDRLAAHARGNSTRHEDQSPEEHRAMRLGYAYGEETLSASLYKEAPFFGGDVRMQEAWRKGLVQGLVSSCDARSA